jgi:hypothetical protein
MRDGGHLVVEEHVYDGLQERDAVDHAACERDLAQVVLQPANENDVSA